MLLSARKSAETELAACRDEMREEMEAALHAKGGSESDAKQATVDVAAAVARRRESVAAEMSVVDFVAVDASVGSAV